jgi:hypothetical protein
MKNVNDEVIRPNFKDKSTVNKAQISLKVTLYLPSAAAVVVLFIFTFFFNLK